MISRLNVLELTPNDLNLLFNYDIDWTKEPKESLKELCKQHAQYIRDSYDYVILYFSGGSDSTTVLNSFLDNDIKIDEIITTTFDRVDIPCFDGLYAQEYLKTKSFTGIFTNPIITYDSVKTFISSDKKLSDAQNITGTINSLSRMNINSLEENGLSKTSMISRKGRIAHVYGFETPSVIKIKNNYYVLHSLSKELVIKCSMTNDVINFFSSKQFPKLYAKQAHMIAKFMQKTNIDQLSLSVINKIVRDTYNPIISPPKSGATNFINFPQKKSEALMIYKTFAKEETFKDLYLNSVLYQQVKIENNITKISEATKKYDLLF